MRNEFEWKWDKWRIRQIMKKNRKQGVTKIDLFLDFDGVINVFLLPGTEKYEEKAKQEVFEFADKDCVKRVSDLCLEKTAVLSSLPPGGLRDLITAGIISIRQVWMKGWRSPM